MESKQIRGLMEAYASIYNTTISESHFKVGDEVEIKSNGMEGEIVKVDPEGEGKYYTVKHEDGKTKKYSPDELKLDKEEEKGEKEEEGASKEKEGEFHDKLDKMVHKTFGKRPEEKKMKEELELGEARAMSHTGGTPHPLQGDGSRPRGMGGKSFGIEDLPPPSKPKTVKDVKESADLFDIILEHLVAEGYADTNKAALAIMANMSEEWKQSIMEGPGGMMMSAASRGQGSLRASTPPSPAPRPRNPNEGGPGSQNTRPRLTTGQQMSAPSPNTPIR